MPRFNPHQPDSEAVPPEQVRILELKVEPWPDGRRVRVHLRLTPFQIPPNLEARITNAGGEIIASAYIVENIDFDLVITMHIRGPVENDPYSISASVIYEDFGIVHKKTEDFSVSPNDE